MDDGVASIDAGLDGEGVTHVTGRNFQPGLIFLWVVEGGDIEDTDFLDAVPVQAADEVDAEETATAGDEDTMGGGWVHSGSFFLGVVTIGCGGGKAREKGKKCVCQRGRGWVSCGHERDFCVCRVSLPTLRRASDAGFSGERVSLLRGEH